MRCEDCRRIHHELPNLLVPYKRYQAECIESVVTKAEHCVATDESTLHRWKIWFKDWAKYASGCLNAIASRFELPVKVSSRPLHPSLQSIGRWVGNADGWLARTVRPIANENLWIHTRSAFLS
ncbi:hypothetical protein JZ785_04655 [Alicyclobacillus curvatus]|nr:hypothetical protein JZ785_04655 [Alicyclobacillus curvatus]